jgi:DNA-binding transcriptional MerR regulator
LHASIEVVIPIFSTKRVGYRGSTKFCCIFTAMVLEQLDLFGNPVIIETSKKEKSKLVQQPLFEAEFNDDVTPPSTNITSVAATTATIDTAVKSAAFTIETVTPITEIIVSEKAPVTEPPPQPFVYTDNNIRVKIKAKPQPKKALAPTIDLIPEPQIVDTVAITPVEKTLVATETTMMATPMPAKRTAPEYVSNLHKRGRKSHKDLEASADLTNIPDDETLNQKLYYGITEVAGWFNVNVSQIRFWENEFDILQPRKTKKGDRLFRVEDIKNLELIYHLIRQRKFSIEGAKAYLKNNKQAADTNFKVTQSLTKFRSFLLELKANLGT